MANKIATKKKLAEDRLGIDATDDQSLAFAADLTYRAMIEAGEPVKASDIARRIARPDFDVRLARVVLVSNPDRFTSSERKWTLWTRYGDPTRTLDRTLVDLLNLYGCPITAEELSRELAAIFNRSEMHFSGVLSRTLLDTTRFFKVGSDHFGLRSWLLDIESDNADDILFDNYLTAQDVEFAEVSVDGLSMSSPTDVATYLNLVDLPVSSKLLQFLAWKEDPLTFNPEAHFNALFSHGIFLLSTGEWIGESTESRLVERFEAISQREVDEHGDNADSEATQPLVITDDEKEQLVQAVLEGNGPGRVTDLLETVFEVTEGDNTFDQDLETVREALRADDRIVWVGGERFVTHDDIPEYVKSVPENLRIPEGSFVDVEGNDVDQILEDDGFDGALLREIATLVAQDVLDEDLFVMPDIDPPATVRCVLKFHHKEIGTYPLCQLPPSFFPTEPEILQVDLVLPSGHNLQLWVNNRTRLVFGLLDWYQTLPVDSGAVFYLERQDSDQYVLTYGEETEPAMFISRNRVNELIELGRRAEDEELPTYEVVRIIMEHYRKGIEFITLLTEANIARRTSRRMVASILSGYHCFFQRGGAWVFDAKKQSQGFDKSKRKYLKK